MIHVTTLLIIYLAAVNLLGFTIMGIDKYRARKRAFRIPEATLFTIALIGGSMLVYSLSESLDEERCEARSLECIPFTIKPGTAASLLACLPS